MKDRSPLEQGLITKISQSQPKEDITKEGGKTPKSESVPSQCMRSLASNLEKLQEGTLKVPPATTRIIINMRVRELENHLEKLSGEQKVQAQNLLDQAKKLAE